MGWRQPGRRSSSAAAAAWAAAFLLGGGAAVWGGDPATDAGAGPSLRLGLTSRLMAGVNRSDARAAIAVWTQEVLHTARLNIDLRGQVIYESGELEALIRAGKLDVFCLTLPEYRRLAAFIESSQIITDSYGGEALILLVRGDRGIVDLAAAAGKRLIILESPPSVLADAWLGTVLDRAGLAPPERYFGRVARTPKVTQAILPVFFGQADLCLVTKRAWETMFEMNPQLGRQMRVLTESPIMISAVFAVHKNVPAAQRKTLFERLGAADQVPRAAQMMALFQARGFKPQDVSVLKAPLALLDAYEQIKGIPGGRR